MEKIRFFIACFSPFKQRRFFGFALNLCGFYSLRISTEQFVRHGGAEFLRGRKANFLKIAACITAGGQAHKQPVISLNHTHVFNDKAAVQYKACGGFQVIASFGKQSFNFCFDIHI